jgi:hypothetical protein
VENYYVEEERAIKCFLRSFLFYFMRMNKFSDVHIYLLIKKKRREWFNKNLIFFSGLNSEGSWPRVNDLICSAKQVENKMIKKGHGKIFATNQICQ